MFEFLNNHFLNIYLVCILNSDEVVSSPLGGIANATHSGGITERPGYSKYVNVSTGVVPIY